MSDIGGMGDESIREEILANGVTLQFFDQSNRYFGDYHRVKIVVSGTIVVDGRYFPLTNGTTLETAIKCLGESFTVERSLEAMGVPSSAVESKRNGLIETFVETTMPYMARSDFPIKSIQAELTKRKPAPRSIRTLSLS